MLLLAMPITLLAQTSASSQLTEMKKLDFLVGQWQGEGWYVVGPGKRRTFKQTENIQRKVDGLVLLIEGLGKGKIDDKGEEVTIHSAFAAVSYDNEAKAFRWRAFAKGKLAGGNWIDVEPKVSENKVVWGFRDAQAAEIRFTITLNEKGQWFEIGEVSSDGKTWQKFFEMTLNRVK